MLDTSHAMCSCTPVIAAADSTSFRKVWPRCGITSGYFANCRSVTGPLGALFAGLTRKSLPSRSGRISSEGKGSGL